MKEDGIATFTFLRQPLEFSHYIRTCRFGVFSVVHKHDDVILLEPVNLHDIFFNIYHVVVTPRELATGSDIIDADEQRAPRPRPRSYHEGILEVERPAAGELRHLREAVLQLVPQAFQDLNVGQVRLRRPFVVVEDAQQGGRARASRLAGGVGEAELLDVADVGGGLGVATSRDHQDGGGDHRRLFIVGGLLSFIETGFEILEGSSQKGHLSKNRRCCVLGERRGMRDWILN
mmetsp:Transcript_19096/g.43468  ORF Transcript_19096/g.43468 Transcript_19096/m.43468 type:complete len:232 (-) Transcript_19096:28-723(-)